jgi:hypothetical protein
MQNYTSLRFLNQIGPLWYNVRNKTHLPQTYLSQTVQKIWSILLHNSTLQYTTIGILSFYFNMGVQK